MLCVFFLTTGYLIDFQDNSEGFLNNTVLHLACFRTGLLTLSVGKYCYCTILLDCGTESQFLLKEKNKQEINIKIY